MPIDPTSHPGTLAVEPDVRRRIEEYARTEGVAPSEVVRKAFETLIAVERETKLDDPSEETAFDVLDRAGLIGCLASTPDSPTDLATNPKYMEGFGS